LLFRANFVHFISPGLAFYKPAILPSAMQNRNPGKALPPLSATSFRAFKGQWFFVI